VQWSAESDVFKETIKDRPLTQRGILSIISFIYDPLDFLSPVILRAKIILQDRVEEHLDGTGKQGKARLFK